jgi:hypothetical protein
MPFTSTKRGALADRVGWVPKGTGAELRVPSGLVKRERSAFRPQRIGDGKGTGLEALDGDPALFVV